MEPMWMNGNLLIGCAHACKIVSAWISEDEVSRLYTVVPLKIRTVRHNHDEMLPRPPAFCIATKIQEVKCGGRVNQMNTNMNTALTKTQHSARTLRC